MIKKIALIFLAILMLTTAGCRRKTQETTAPSTVEETVETQEVTVPGVEDSIFEDMQPTEQAETVPETTAEVPSDTEPQKPEANASGSSSGGAQSKNPAPGNPGSSGIVSEPKDTVSESSGSASKPTEPPIPTTDNSGTVEPAPEVTVPTEAVVELPEPGEMDFLTFQNMEAAQQRAYQESFESLDAFYDWYIAAQEAYNQENAPIDAGSGVIDMGEILGKQ